MALGNIITGQDLKSVKIDTNLSSKQFCFVDFDASDDGVVNLKENGTTNPAFVLIDDGDGSTTPKTGSIVVNGTTKVLLGGSVNPGVALMPTTAGKAITATDGNYFSGIALKGGVDGDVIEMRVAQGYLETT